jgi:hypothetical protein
MLPRSRRQWVDEDNIVRAPRLLREDLRCAGRSAEDGKSKPGLTREHCRDEVDTRYAFG